MSTQDLTPDQLKATETILKLLALAAKAGTPEEAASANAKATLEDPKSVRREKSAVEGGGEIMKGLLRDRHGRRLTLMDPVDAEQRLKERPSPGDDR